ncbi:PTS sugar transporter subunit IIC [Lactobacillus sp. ESL0785]|uniref:PTS mannose/fructose/sorbose/N-acetylgalactosamine transporter subunit IIC n=1 Tax=Lactobacillus sp. ESL0785 TaxID=2983232 RepID=UPI0023F89E80|nr:PTS sugar transporter subunit IIC [Lactobacillus sp. ESL0785]WEV70917.1 PTS sugar transporter subunit IIC [Lactobacillus sp. ESL0785]
MSISIWQIILLTIIAYLAHFDFNSIQLFTFNSLIWGLLAGLIMGDMKTGVEIGATVQLMSLGVVAVGGASIPNYPVTAIITTAIAISTGKGLGAGIAIGLPVGILGVQLDILWKMFNGWTAIKAQKYADEKKYGAMQSMTLLSTYTAGLVSALPVFLSVAFGPSLIKAILDFMPKWFTSGLQLAGAMLPAVGIAMLLIYMPSGKMMEYLLIGFVLSAYLKVPIIGVSLIGLALMYHAFKELSKKSNAVVEKTDNAVTESNTMIGVDEDE